MAGLGKLEYLYPDPERFDPDRWLTASERQQKAWIPHGGGLPAEGHRCAGEALATLMLKVFAVRMLGASTGRPRTRTCLPPRGSSGELEEARAGQGVYDKRPQPARAEIRRPGDGST